MTQKLKTKEPRGSYSWLRATDFAIWLSIVAASVSPSFADQASENAGNPCEGSWQEVVEQLHSQVQSARGHKQIILFVGDDGNAFNCLKMDVPEGTVKAVTFVEAQLVQLENNVDQNSRFRTRYCSSGRGFIGKFDVTRLHLPYNADELASDACVARLQSTLKMLGGL
ncbi:hypothetical protein [Ruegeria faecimaris]|uniref:hypothetical protein n=1 Tax=Ruegeria faecimaris TaxID=686389 RepID=UPI002492B722|nr:hypothetical protein [Ruegeria faecimaris]